MRTRAAAAVGLMVFAVGCGSTSSPTVPTQSQRTSTRDFSGIWGFDYRVTNCLYHWCGIGEPGSFRLRLLQTGATIDGLFIEPGLVGRVTGGMRGSGELALEGVTPGVAPGVSIGQIEVRILLRDGPMGFTGMMQLRIHQSPEVGLAPRGCGLVCDMSADVVSGTLQSPLGPSTSFAGTWSGRGATRECTSTGPAITECFFWKPEQLAGFHVQLTEAGGIVNGTFSWKVGPIPVTGTASNGRLTFEGEWRHGEDHRWRASFSGTRDALGRLTGWYTVTEDWNAPPSFFSSSALSVELLTVALID